MSIIEVGFVTFCKHMRFACDSMANSNINLEKCNLDEYLKSPNIISSKCSDNYLKEDLLERWWNRMSSDEKKYYYDLEMKSTINIGRPDIMYIR